MVENGNPFKAEYDRMQREAILEQTGKDINEATEEEREELVSYFEIRNRQVMEEQEAERQRLIECAKKDSEQRNADSNCAEFLLTVPDRYLRADINYYKSKPELKPEALLIQRMLTPRDLGYGVYKMPDAFIYSSENGTGKTYFAYAYALFLAGKGKRCKVIKALHLLNEFKDFESSSYESKLKKYRDYDLLVVDECDKIVGSKFDSSCFFDIIDERYDFLKQTVLIANSNNPQEVVGSACLSRIAEDTNGKNVYKFSREQHRINIPE